MLNESDSPRNALAQKIASFTYSTNSTFDWKRRPPEWDVTYDKSIDDIARCRSYVSDGLSDLEIERLQRRAAIADAAWREVDPKIREEHKKRERKNAAAEAAKNAEKYVESGGRVEIVVEAGERNDSVKVIAKLLGSCGKYFNRGGRLMRLVTLPQDMEDEDGTKRAAGSIILKVAEVPAVVSDVSRIAKVKKFDGRKNANVPTDLPAEIAKSVIAVGVEDQSIKELRGIIYCPIFRDNGDIVTKRGYDSRTHLYLAADVDWSALNVPDKPSREDAIAAAKWIVEEIYGEFSTDDVGRSVMFSSLVSSVLRPYLDGSPLHCVDGATYGVGKSMVAEIVGIVAMGVKPPMTLPGETKEETMKRVEAVTRSGDAINVLDNLSQPLTGDALCGLITAEVVNIRVFGTNTVERLRPSSFWMATGQNLTVSADMIRRSLSVRIDPGIERPELSKFKKPHLIGWVKEHRMEILSKIYLILRAHAQSGFPCGDGEPLHLGSFSGWARRVAGLCTWLGFVSPMKSQDKLYSEDPLRNRRATAIDAIFDWQESRTRKDGSYIVGAWYAKDMLEAAKNELGGFQDLSDFVKSEIREPTVAALSGWFKRIRDQVTGGKKLIRYGQDSVTKTALWYVEIVDPTIDVGRLVDLPGMEGGEIDKFTSDTWRLIFGKSAAPDFDVRFLNEG